MLTALLIIMRVGSLHPKAGNAYAKTANLAQLASPSRRVGSIPPETRHPHLQVTDATCMSAGYRYAGRPLGTPCSLSANVENVMWQRVMALKTRLGELTVIVSSDNSGV